MNGSSALRYSAYSRMPEQWRPAFAVYQQWLAQRFGVVGAWLTLFIVPAFQVGDLFVHPATQTLWWDHFWWRLPTLLVSGVILYLHHVRGAGAGPWSHPLLLLLGLAIMLMMVGLLGTHQAIESGAIHLMIRGLIMTTAVVAAFAVFGLRDLLFIYSVSFVALSLFLYRAGTPIGESLSLLAHPLAMALIGCVLAQLLMTMRVNAFCVRQKLEHTAMTDELTSLPNRRFIDWQFEIEHARAQRYNRLYTVLIVDIDHFKRVNDTYGHDVGDEVLIELASRMTAAIRTEDKLGRWGGEEFVVLLPDTGETDAWTVAEKLRQQVASKRFSTTAGDLELTISVGIAEFANEQEPAPLVKRADQALYQAKYQGRNRCVSA